ncbi:LysR family transcriptional regulator [Nocardia tengchongensis]|uniref:LysR family transcriptional regulator n=1 Tax=Nocardia tengchongensis TaxID=2055889 RepID=A0ABX8CPG1_9NOCA|nr:LysR family transcriptional regulator [Nocardia tengchongensis]
MEVHTRQLRYFIAIAEELSFTRAARRLGISQQCLSMQIKQLERTLDLMLFARTTRRIELTVAGSAFLADIERTLDSVDAAVDRARGIQRGECDRLVLGTLEGAALTLTDPILAAFQQRHPRVTVQQRQFSYDDPSAGLRDDAVDVAFVRRPFDHTGIHCETLFSEPLMVMLPEDHRLADRAEVSVRELVDEPIIGAAALGPGVECLLGVGRLSRRPPRTDRPPHRIGAGEPVQGAARPGHRGHRGGCALAAVPGDSAGADRRRRAERGRGRLARYPRERAGTFVRRSGHADQGHPTGPGPALAGAGIRRPHDAAAAVIDGRGQ